MNVFTSRVARALDAGAAQAYWVAEVGAGLEHCTMPQLAFSVSNLNEVASMSQNLEIY